MPWPRPRFPLSTPTSLAMQPPSGRSEVCLVRSVSRRGPERRHRRTDRRPPLQYWELIKCSVRCLIVSQTTNCVAFMLAVAAARLSALGGPVSERRGGGCLGRTESSLLPSGLVGASGCVDFLTAVRMDYI